MKPDTVDTVHVTAAGLKVHNMVAGCCVQQQRWRTFEGFIFFVGKLK